MPQVLHNKSRKFDRVKKFGVKKKRWEVDNEEIISLEARLQDLESVRSHAVLNDIRVLNYWRNKFMYLYQVSLQTAYRVHFLVFSSSPFIYYYSNYYFICICELCKQMHNRMTRNFATAQLI